MNRRSFIAVTGASFLIGIILTLSTWYIVLAGPMAVCKYPSSNGVTKSELRPQSQELRGFPVSYYYGYFPDACNTSPGDKEVDRIYTFGLQWKALAADLGLWTSVPLLIAGLVSVRRMKKQSRVQSQSVENKEDTGKS